MKRMHKCAEAAWFFGVLIIALGVCLVTKGGFGVSMVVAPAYIIHLAVAKNLAWYSFGTSEYILQGVLLAAMCLVIRKFNWRFLLSFFTAVIYGYVLDGWFLLFGGSAPFTGLPMRILSLAAGIVCTAFAIALFFRTYLPQQVYELFVARVAAHFHFKTEKCKLVYDVSSLGVAIVLAVLVSRQFSDIRFTDCIGIGTIACTLFNAPLIMLCGKLLDKLFGFEAACVRLEKALKYQDI